MVSMHPPVSLFRGIIWGRENEFNDPGLVHWPAWVILRDDKGPRGKAVCGEAVCDSQFFILTSCRQLLADSRRSHVKSFGCDNK